MGHTNVGGLVAKIRAGGYDGEYSGTGSNVAVGVRHCFKLGVATTEARGNLRLIRSDYGCGRYLQYGYGVWNALATFDRGNGKA